MVTAGESRPRTTEGGRKKPRGSHTGSHGAVERGHDSFQHICRINDDEKQTIIAENVMVFGKSIGMGLLPVGSFTQDVYLSPGMHALVSLIGHKSGFLSPLPHPKPIKLECLQERRPLRRKAMSSQMPMIPATI